MKSIHFPISYVASCFSPKKMFTGRKRLSVGQMFVVIIFLIFLLMNPVALNARNLPFLNLADVTPHLMADLATNKANAAAVQQLNIENNQLEKAPVGQLGPQIYAELSDKDADKVATGIIFNRDNFVIKDQNGITFSLAYTQNMSFSRIENSKELIDTINTSWNEQTTGYRIISTTLLIGGLLIVSTLILVFGASFFIWLTRKNQFSTISTYQESLNLILNALFIPTLIALVSGLFMYDLSLMLTIQSLGLAVVIMLVFVKTKFNDGLAKNEQLIISQ
ncbi:hypothetical protein ACWOAH_02615 [Vagococcus vulneris]|uniref:Maltodextrose utilization protein MalA n=1 Tax=Vagococcus vulneris TaxID=1977869 RepID=A0A430A0X1_9ENTE|nr:hypothetical protein [Vagococcus vulneris]RSU00051.1 hypothetical protein CBF37_01755 [Vagococcus vulneris]